MAKRPERRLATFRQLRVRCPWTDEFDDGHDECLCPHRRFCVGRVPCNSEQCPIWAAMDREETDE